MQLLFPFRGEVPPRGRGLVRSGRATWIVEFVRRRRARHYVLRVADDGSVSVTVPWGGSRAEAERFVRERSGWIERERYRQAVEASWRGPWRAGTRIPYRGADVALEICGESGRVAVRFADQILMVPAEEAGDLRPHVERHLRTVAARELPKRVQELAALHGYRPAKVSVRNQRSRWGSCSPGGHISLNWRLVQMPPAVSDYVLLHELAHLRHDDHSPSFWREVERLCPSHREARAWLRAGLRGGHGLIPTA
jgi:predicted metal-dependent hydrolase